MRTVVIANPQAGGGRVGRRWEHYKGSAVKVFAPTEMCLTTRRGEACDLVRRAIVQGAQRIVVIGGDGTVNEAVNGFFDGERPIGANVVLAVCAAGTGGDFVRTLGISGLSMEAAFAGAVVRRVDLGRASFTALDGSRQSRYFLNIASLGSSAVVVERVNRTSKRFGAKCAFYVGTLRGLAAYRNQAMQLSTQDGASFGAVINTVAIANGRYFGGGMMIAPHGRLDDGLLDVVVVGDVGVAKFIAHSHRLYCGTHLDLPFVCSYVARTLDVSASGDSAVLVELDGELVGALPAKFEVLPSVLLLLAPPAQ